MLWGHDRCYLVSMVYETYKQLQGKRGQRRVKNAEVGLADTLGGVLRSSYISLLSN
jgi:hypothetical protein